MFNIQKQILLYTYNDIVVVCPPFQTKKKMQNPKKNKTKIGVYIKV